MCATHDIDRITVQWSLGSHKRFVGWRIKCTWHAVRLPPVIRTKAQIIGCWKKKLFPATLARGRRFIFHSVKQNKRTLLWRRFRRVCDAFLNMFPPIRTYSILWFNVRNCIFQRDGGGSLMIILNTRYITSDKLIPSTDYNNYIISI